MNHKWMAALIAATATTALASIASAQESTKDEASPSDANRTRELPAANRAVELTIGTGYAQGFGSVGSGQPTLQDQGAAGGALQIGVGVRVIPQLTLGVYGSGAMFGRADTVESSANIYSATAGIQADWHFLPAGHVWDPWVSLGTGWRGYWVHTDPQGTTSLQGMELAKFQLGVDYRIAPTVSISPVIGADLSTFFTESTPQSNGFSNLSSPEINTFIFGGVMGRFDIPTQATDRSVASR